MPWRDSSKRRHLERAFEKGKLHPRTAPEAGGWEVVKRYVAPGLGVAVVPECCLELRDRKRIGVRSVRQLFDKDAYGGLVKRGRYLSAAVREMIHLVDPTAPLGSV